MKHLVILPLLFLTFLTACGQTRETRENYDLLTYTAPKGWSKEERKDFVAYQIVDKKDGSWCQLLIYKSVPGKGAVQEDWDHDWQELLVTPNQITEAPHTEPAHHAGGWQILTGGARFKFNNGEALAMLTTFSGYQTSMSVVIKSNKKAYVDQALDIITHMDLRQPAPANADHWVTSIGEDWVQATKGPVKVLIHYPDATTSQYRPDRRDEETAIWDHFITPRYTNITHFQKLSNNLSYEAIFFMEANAIDQQGQPVFVALFRQGNTKNSWCEIICSSRAVFVKAFGIDKYDVMFDGWQPLANLSNLNHFAVSVKELQGSWTNNFGGLTRYVNVYTGASAGTKTYQSQQQYDFSGNTYKWQIHAISGFVGAYDQAGARSGGTFSLTGSWNIHFSDIEHKPRDYAVFFTAIKGGRMLWIDGTAFGKK